MFQERQLRNLALKLIEDQFGSNESNLVVEELGLSFGNSRVDIAVVNGSLIGFEIKSDFDNLKRLPSQIEMYQRYFDKVFLITTNHHLSDALELIPKNWGVYVAKGEKSDGKLVRVRAAKKNIETDSAYIIRLVWKNEALNYLENLGLRGIKSKTKDELYNLLLAYTSTKRIKQFVIDTLKNRSIWRAV